MCQINLIKKLGKEKTNEVDVNEFFKLLCFGSRNNPDAFGIFNSKSFFKKTGMFDSSKFKNNWLLGKSFFVGHNRLSTSIWKRTTGVKNHHPFNLGAFLLVHNGHISNHKKLRKRYNIKSEIKTDSYIILALINKFFKLARGERKKRVITAIQKTTKEIVGSYSVVLYDSKAKNLYYFKNFMTSFVFCKYDDKVLVGSTNHLNLSLIYFNYKERELFYPEDNKIYMITSNSDIPIKKVGKFKNQFEPILDINDVKGGFQEGFSFLYHNFITKFPGGVVF